ncbi:MAG: hypothetical protein EZS28_003141 [Streblomastix strix]|uniref:FHA domain-containing protein n=1 Tax=Streblomastix strix TaxID=222440 RepID=A0A5J4X3I6_9EUKA|nr:MAG: hypothetical protein EZS28_003140 [Streblomastix strix]KAA6401333.1 MAG: hypothetical protein EZS28_003141 [Streblomastix strix]
MSRDKKQDDIDEQIKLLQQGRKVPETGKVALSAKRARMDTDIYGDGNDDTNYVKYVVPDDENSGDEDAQDFEASDFSDRIKRLESGNRFKEELALQDRSEDVFKNTRAKTVAGQEDGYRQKWRERKLSPPRADPFAKNQINESRTYKEIVKQTFIDKEKQDIIKKINVQKREQVENKITDEDRRKLAEELIKNEQQRRERERDRGITAQNASRAEIRMDMLNQTGFVIPSDVISPPEAVGLIITEKEKEKEKEENQKSNQQNEKQHQSQKNQSFEIHSIKKGLHIKRCLVITQEQYVQNIKQDTNKRSKDIDESFLIIFGRVSEACDIHTDNTSCSRAHAILMFRPKVEDEDFSVKKEDIDNELNILNSDKSTNQTDIKIKNRIVPVIFDNGSTNGTILNTQTLPPKMCVELHSGDKLSFGNDDIEYKILF